MIADNALGLSLMKRDDESLHDYAMSFSPMAPLFGVPYRFSALFKFPAALTAPGAAKATAKAPVQAPTPAPVPALTAPEAPAPAPAPAPAKKAKKAKAKAKAEDLFETEIDAGAAAAKAMASTTLAAFPDDMAEAAPGLEEALDDAPATEPESVVEPEAVVETATEAAAETAEAMTEVVTAAPALLYDSAPDLSDDLKLIKGVGPKLESELNGMGIYTFAQIASMNEANLAWIDGNLSTFKGRSVRDDWIGQATTLLAS